MKKGVLREKISMKEMGSKPGGQTVSNKDEGVFLSRQNLVMKKTII